MQKGILIQRIPPTVYVWLQNCQPKLIQKLRAIVKPPIVGIGETRKYFKKNIQMFLPKLLQRLKNINISFNFKVIHTIVNDWLFYSI